MAGGRLLSLLMRLSHAVALEGGLQVGFLHFYNYHSSYP